MAEFYLGWKLINLSKSVVLRKSICEESSGIGNGKD